MSFGRYVDTYGYLCLVNRGSPWMHHNDAV
jgi:hypothetical protein